MNCTTHSNTRKQLFSLAISVLLGVVFTATGWILVDRAEEHMTRRLTEETSEKVRMGQALLQSKMRAGSAGMSELIALPLFSEYLEIAASGPKSAETEELKLYLQEVLSISHDELGGDVLLAADRSGLVQLIIPENFNDTIPGEFTGTGAFLTSAADGSVQLWMRQPVPGYEQPDNPAGVFYLKFPDSDIAEFEQAGLVLRTVSGMQDAAVAGGSEIAVGIAGDASADSANLLPLRLFVLAAGFAVFAVFAWRSNSR